MKRIVDYLEAKYDEIIEKLKEADAAAYRNQNCECRVYIDTDGDIDYEEWIANDNGYLKFRDPDYERFYIANFCYQYYSALWDWWFEDRDEFRRVFRERFGIDLSEEYEYESIENQGRLTCEDAEIKGYDEWLGEQEDEAIKEAVSEAGIYGQYNALIDGAIELLTEMEDD